MQRGQHSTTSCGGEFHEKLSLAEACLLPLLPFDVVLLQLGK
jgi:hypothetical protein